MTNNHGHGCGCDACANLKPEFTPRFKHGVHMPYLDEEDCPDGGKKHQGGYRHRGHDHDHNDCCGQKHGHSDCGEKHPHNHCCKNDDRQKCNQGTPIASIELTKECNLLTTDTCGFQKTVELCCALSSFRVHGSEIEFRDTCDGKHVVNICDIVADNCDISTDLNGSVISITDIGGCTKEYDICKIVADNCDIETDLNGSVISITDIGGKTKKYDICKIVADNCDIEVEVDGNTLIITDINGDTTVYSPDLCCDWNEGCYDGGPVWWRRDLNGKVEYLIGSDEPTEAKPSGFSYIPCKNAKIPIDMCFVPEPYAVLWTWNIEGRLGMYNPDTDVWTDLGDTKSAGEIVGGYALTVKNNGNKSELYFQSGGCTYKSNLNYPADLIKIGCDPVWTGDEPWLAFDPAGQLWTGPGANNEAGIIDLATGQVDSVGTLIDARDQNTFVGRAGDWYFDPNGVLYLMTEDTRAAEFGDPASKTSLFTVNPDTLIVTKVAKSDSTTGGGTGDGTGAAWFSDGRAYLSENTGDIYVYDLEFDTEYGAEGVWRKLTSAPFRINDLGQQWITPESVAVKGWMTVNGDTGMCEGVELYTMVQDVDQKFVCQPFETNLKGSLKECGSECPAEVV